MVTRPAGNKPHSTFVIHTNRPPKSFLYKRLCEPSEHKPREVTVKPGETKIISVGTADRPGEGAHEHVRLSYDIDPVTMRREGSLARPHHGGLHLTSKGVRFIPEPGATASLVKSKNGEVSSITNVTSKGIKVPHEAQIVLGAKPGQFHSEPFRVSDDFVGEGDKTEFGHLSPSVPFGMGEGRDKDPHNGGFFHHPTRGAVLPTLIIKVKKK